MSASSATPIVTVVIPVRNRPIDLPRAVASVLEQNVPAEIIIIDDASTDQTPAVAVGLAANDTRIHVIAFRENKGGGHARNAGIDQASAPWLAFLDSDDIWLPGKLSAQLEQLQSLGPTPSAIGFTNLLVDTGDGAPAHPWNDIAYGAGMTARQYLLELHQVIQTSTLLMPTAVARQVRFDGALRRHQDLDFVLRAEAAGIQFQYLDRHLVRYSADPQASRVSRRVDATPSLAWLERATKYLTPREIGLFYLRHVYDIELQHAPWPARRRAWRAMRNGASTPAALVMQSVKLSIPPALKARLKALRHG